MHKIEVKNIGRTATALDGEPLNQALDRSGIRLQAPCGGAGTCGKCRVKVTRAAGEVAASEQEKSFIPAEDISEGWRLACRQAVHCDMEVEIPEENLLPENEGLTSGAAVSCGADPVTAVMRVQLPEPSLEDQRSDESRLCEALKCEPPDSPDVMKALPGAVRAEGFTVDAVTRGGRLAGVLAPGDGRRVFGMAVDIGTTTIAAELVDLEAVSTAGVTATSNPQGVAGADVISRMEHVKAQADGLERLSNMVRGAVNGLLDHLLEKTGRGRESVYEITIAGNTVMLHLLLGVNPAAIAEVPFTPVFTRATDTPAADMGMEIAPGGTVHTLPCVSGYVGGDIVAGLAVLEAASLNERPALFIDLGTNGEMVLLTGERMLACSTAAGPAFEGAKISYGMRAIPGAVDRVSMDASGALKWATVEGRPPKGICGSGLIDAAAVFAQAGLMEPAGTIADPADLPEGLRELLVTLPDGETAIRVAGDVTVSQRDIRELQLAKGAVAAGASILLGEAGLKPEDLAKVYIAGAFGSFIRASSAVGISIVPRGIPEEKIHFLGNSALVGARLALVSRAYRAWMQRAAREVEYVELSGRPDFQMMFAENMFFGAAGGGW
ncbi:MAG: DUF4445 domain-containing protein [Planctomycetes bacterium]|nr:DUF4445 domain-containing protein [Planctomycetota bacterium]